MISVLFVAAEAYPLIKSGGLGDVAGALPAALRRLGIDARLMMPCYKGIRDMVPNLSPGPSLGPIFDGLHARILTGYLPGSDLPLMLVDCPPLYNRAGGAYQAPNGADWPDNYLRFGLLARVAALTAIAGEVAGWRPDIVHANDWHTGLLPYYLKSWGGPAPRSVFTAHNMAYQGLYGPEIQRELALRVADFSPEGFEFWGRVSFLKAGLVYADQITTVSPTYAKEIQRAPLGAGLEGVLAARRLDLIGITNGVDDKVWNPARDEFITRHYTAATLGGKRENTASIRKVFNLSDCQNKPLIGVVSRLVEQKGIDLIAAVIPSLVAAGAQLVVLGRGDAVLEETLRAGARGHPSDVAVHIGYDEAFAHRIIAGCDMLLMPSRFEPCGLTQLYAQSYGTLPIVRRTGGLADTIHDGHDGFSFEAPTAGALLHAVKRAIAVFHRLKDWRKLQRQALSRDVSWDGCAQRYVDLYRSLIPTRIEG